MHITHVFTDSGTPTSGLSPTINIYEVDTGNQVVTNASMTEIGSTGIYKYNFTARKQSKEYVWKADGTSTLATASERYISGKIESSAEEYLRQRDWTRKLEGKG